MKELIFVAIAGALGALVRWGLSSIAARMMGAGFPYGTFIVNILGCFLLGAVMYIGLNTDMIPQAMRLGVSIGFLGALTTFSTFSYETVVLIQDGAWGAAAGNIVGNVILGLAAVMLGLGLGRAIVGGN